MTKSMKKRIQELEKNLKSQENMHKLVLADLWDKNKRIEKARSRTDMALWNIHNSNYILCEQNLLKLKENLCDRDNEPGVLI